MTSGDVLKKSIMLLISLLTPMLTPLPAYADAGSAFYTGLWEYTIDVKMQAIPQSELKKVRQCIKSLNQVIRLFKPDPSCSTSHVKLGPSKVSWKLSCKTDGGTDQGDAKLEGDTHALHGRVDLQTVIPGMRDVMRTSYIITGINKGPCQ
jgi:hypothetical protein